MLSDVQQKILISNRKELLKQIMIRDEVIDFLLAALEAEAEYRGLRKVYSEKIFEGWGLDYRTTKSKFITE